VKNVKLVINLILIGLAVIFIVQNVTVVEVRFLVWTLPISRSLLIFSALAVGIVVGWMLRSLSASRREEE